MNEKKTTLSECEDALQVIRAVSVAARDLIANFHLGEKEKAREEISSIYWLNEIVIEKAELLVSIMNKEEYGE